MLGKKESFVPALPPQAVHQRGHVYLFGVVDLLGTPERFLLNNSTASSQLIVCIYIHLLQFHSAALSGNTYYDVAKKADTLFVCLFIESSIVVM